MSDGISPDRPVERRILLGTGLFCHLLEWGGDDPVLSHTVILLHGFLDLCWGWEALVRAGLQGRYHIVAPDLRGHGDSDPIGPGGYYHFLDYLADVHDLIGQVGRQTVSLVGHSMGGSIAGYYAGAFPDRVHRLALLEGTGPPEDPTPGPARVVAWLRGWERVRASAGRQRSYGDVAEAAVQLRRHDPLLDEPLSLWLAEKGTRRDADGRLRFKHDPLHTTTGPYPFRVDFAQRFWTGIRCPVLLVEGEKSLFRLAPEEQQRRESSFAHAQRATLAGAGHMMQRHQPAALCRMLSAFLG